MKKVIHIYDDETLARSEANDIIKLMSDMQKAIIQKVWSEPNHSIENLDKIISEHSEITLLSNYKSIADSADPNNSHLTQHLIFRITTPCWNVFGLINMIDPVYGFRAVSSIELTFTECLSRHCPNSKFSFTLTKGGNVKSRTIEIK